MSRRVRKPLIIIGGLLAGFSLLQLIPYLPTYPEARLSEADKDHLSAGITAMFGIDARERGEQGSDDD